MKVEISSRFFPPIILLSKSIIDIVKIDVPMTRIQRICNDLGLGDIGSITDQNL